MKRYGILGFGHHAAKRMVPGFPGARKSRLAGLWRRDQSKAEVNARELGVAVFPTAEALCASPEIDAVFIASPDALHLQDGLLALKHGKPVLCEKPLGDERGRGGATHCRDTASRRAVWSSAEHAVRSQRAVDSRMDRRRPNRQAVAGALSILLLGREVVRANGSTIRRWLSADRSATWASIASTHCGLYFLPTWLQ